MPIPENVLHQLYLIEQNSMHDISKTLKCSIHKVQYWLDKYQIARRSHSDANYTKYNPKGDPFKIKKRLSREEQNLYYLAIGLYWGEGGKTNHHSARLTNSDPAMIVIYYQFLTTVCQIRPGKIHFHLQTFRDNDVVAAKTYWSKQINISPHLINISTPIPPQGKGTYRRINNYGVMTVGVYNTHFRAWMMEQLHKLGYNPGWLSDLRCWGTQAVNEGRL